MKKSSVIALFLLSVLLLGGCANNRYCLEKQGYEGAGSIPPLQSADGLQIPQSAGALVVPAPPPQAERVPFGQTVKNAKGEEKIACLDKPPPMPKPQGNEIRE